MTSALVSDLIAARAQHTPGPWYFSRMERPPIGRQPNGEPWPTDASGNVFWGYSIGGRNENGAAILPTLAAVHNFPDQIDANARLIAVAPELLEACQRLLEELRLIRMKDSDAVYDVTCRMRAEVAISKALGEPHA